MRKRYLAVAVATIAAATLGWRASGGETATAASDSTAALAVAHQFVDGFNKGDARSALAACAEQVAIVDEFPPYAWQGAGACEAWMNGYDANAAQEGITDGVVTLGAPRYAEVRGDGAYLVIPSDYAWKQRGKPMKETGSTFTFAMHREQAGWRIVGWSWGRN
jgi:hypothetical protein